MYFIRASCLLFVSVICVAYFQEEFLKLVFELVVFLLLRVSNIIAIGL